MAPSHSTWETITDSYLACGNRHHNHHNHNHHHHNRYIRAQSWTVGSTTIVQYFAKNKSNVTDCKPKHVKELLQIDFCLSMKTIRSLSDSAHDKQSSFGASRMQLRHTVSRKVYGEKNNTSKPGKLTSAPYIDTIKNNKNQKFLSTSTFHQLSESQSIDVITSKLKQ